MNFYYCKGDNSFAIEKLRLTILLELSFFSNVDGIFFINLPNRRGNSFIILLKVGVEFCKIGFDKKKIFNSEIYVDYKKKYLLE